MRYELGVLSQYNISYKKTAIKSYIDQIKKFKSTYMHCRLKAMHHRCLKFMKKAAKTIHYFKGPVVPNH